MKDETEIAGINDSKKLSPKKRELLYDLIVKNVVDYSIFSVSEKIIDKINILNATFLAMGNAIENLKIKPDVALIDGNRAPNIKIPFQAIIKGDTLSASIACASILAKVARDRFMVELSEQYPEYSFEKHKGYGTKLHIEKILKHGPCEIHRKSFLKKILIIN